jgi:hypothetical protein
MGLVCIPSICAQVSGGYPCGEAMPRFCAWGYKTQGIQVLEIRIAASILALRRSMKG